MSLHAFKYAKMWINAVDSTVGFCQFKSVIDDDLDNDLNDDLDLIPDRLFYRHLVVDVTKL